MFYLVFVIFGFSCGLVASFDKDLTVFHLEDGPDVFKENSGFYRNELRRPKFVDVYTNHPDTEEVRNSFYKNYNLQNTNHEIHKHLDSGPVDRKDTINFQNLDRVLSSQDQDVLDSAYGHIETDIYNSDSNIGNRDSQYFGNEYGYSDRNNYYYPDNTRFKTKNIYQTLNDKKTNKFLQDEDEKNFVLLQSQLAVPDSENYGSFYAPADVDLEHDSSEKPKPNFVTKKSNVTGELPNFLDSVDSDGNDTLASYSYVQKIPLYKKSSTTVLPEIFETDSNKYEEIDLSENERLEDTNVKTPNTKKRIGDLLKKYITQIFVGKYANKKFDTEKTIFKNNNVLKNGSRLSKVPNNSTRQKIPKIDQESKLFTNNALMALKNKTITKIKNFFSIFTVIKFSNTECNATNWAGTWQGFCYTDSECADMNGTALGNCASGYGVCCVFRGSCGDSSNRNCSYFKSPNYPDYYPATPGVITPTTTAVAPTGSTSPFPTPDPRLHWYYYNQGNGDEELDNLMKERQDSNAQSNAMPCTFSVTKSDPSVNSIRIDFIDLDLTGPTNGTCTQERLVITGQNANDVVPVICGYNTGQHVYVDVSQLKGPLRIMVLSTTGARKRFKLRICQFSDSCGIPQSNCLQYYTGVRGVIQSFNYDQAAMFNRSSPGYFNGLNYAICIRREAGYCSITYSNVQNGQTYPFQLVNRLSNGQLTVPAGQAGVDIINCPDDYIVIDGTRLCGERFNDGSTVSNFSLNAPVVDTSAGPIVINVRTNANVTGLGFKLTYTQNRCAGAGAAA